MGEHIFDKDSVSTRGVIYKDVGDGTDNFSVLEDRGTAHALDDSTGFFQQSFIRYLDFDSAVDVVVVRVVIQHFLKTIVVQFVFEVIG